MSVVWPLAHLFFAAEKMQAAFVGVWCYANQAFGLFFPESAVWMQPSPPLEEDQYPQSAKKSDVQGLLLPQWPGEFPWRDPAGLLCACGGG